MFSNSDIIQEFKLDRQKSLYLAHYGNRPYFKSYCTSNLKNQIFWLLRLMRILTLIREMDVVLRYLNNKNAWYLILKLKFTGVSWASHLIELILKMRHISERVIWANYTHEISETSTVFMRGTCWGDFRDMFMCIVFAI